MNLPTEARIDFFLEALVANSAMLLQGELEVHLVCANYEFALYHKLFTRKASVINMSLLGSGKSYSGNGKYQNAGISMCGGKEPYGFKLETYPKEIRIRGAENAINDLIPLVTCALMNYSLDAKKNKRP